MARPVSRITPAQRRVSPSPAARTSATRRPRPNPPAARPKQPRGILPFKYSFIRIFALTSVSMFYPLYWFYVTRRNVSKELGSGDQAGLQTAGLFVPVLYAFIVYWLFRDIAVLRTKAGLPAFSAKTYVLIPLSLFVTSAVLFIIGAILGEGALAVVLLVIAILLAFSYIIIAYVTWGLVIQKLNQYWDARGTSAEASFSDGETAVLLAGMLAPLAFFFVFGFISALTNPDFGDSSRESTEEQYELPESSNSADYL